ncbi:MAG: type II toxin-antitoxin system HicB family antitoxin [Candidatus Dormibacteria bacterium]
MTSTKVTAVVTQEGRVFVARGVEVDVASQGESVEAALRSLQEAIELYFENEAHAPPSLPQAEVRSIEVSIPA